MTSEVLNQRDKAGFDNPGQDRHRLHVSIVCYNSSESILGTLASLQKAAEPAAAITVVILFNSYLSFPPPMLKFGEYPNLSISILLEEGNLGYAGGHNKVVRHILKELHECTHLLLLNPDIRKSPGLIEGLTLSITKSSDIFSVSPTKTQGQGTIKKTKKAGHCLRTPKINYLGEVGRNYYDHNLLETCTGTGACLLLDFRVLTQVVGLLNEDYFMYLEETELLLRAKNLGFKNLVLESESIGHNIGEPRFKPLKTYYSTRNALFLLEHIQGWRKLPYILGRFVKPFAVYGLRFIFSLDLGNAQASMHGFIHGLSKRNGICTRYHSVIQQRQV